MRMILLSTVFMLLLYQAVYAATTTGGYIACISEEKLDEFISAQVQNDKDGMEFLLKSGCTITKAGIKLSILDRSWTVSKVRAYVGDSAVVLWTPNENISK